MLLDIEQVSYLQLCIMRKPDPKTVNSNAIISYVNYVHYTLRDATLSLRKMDTSHGVLYYRPTQRACDFCI